MRWILLLTFLLSTNALGFDHTHSEWQKVLTKYVKIENSQSLINYNLLKKEKQLLNNYLQSLSSVKKAEYKSWESSKKLAFLINAYNAFTIELILTNYPLKSIKDLGSLFKSAWKISFFTLLEEKHHLDWIEQDMIRGNFKEPRIHFAVVCASISCPNLQKKAFTFKNLDAQLETAAHEFLNDRSKNYFDGEKLYISKIFGWYKKDFKNFRKFISKRMSKNKSIQEKIQNPKLSVKQLNYNWQLNEWK
ncbi:hypothetical protein A9Q84_06665 [Halobacteriovorax marinus]|uniref:DUF547 domain-containing protein n=1 Tax=Halobacteriovorax marinus TaxID=97084 RepID=A0A1Y5FFE2_9BACT|nr:hypothetical protein A9Q84_06665 [Halobacteriovorax marinus]